MNYTGSCEEPCASTERMARSVDCCRTRVARHITWSFDFDFGTVHLRINIAIVRQNAAGTLPAHTPS